VTHQNPLHVDLLTQCWCCQALQPFRFTSPTDQVVCSFCVRHLGAEKAEGRDRDHVRMWVERFAEQQESSRSAATALKATLAEKDAALAALAAQVDDLTNIVAGEFDRTRLGGVRSLLEGEIVTRAERKAELANRRTDWAMAALWRVERLHREDQARPLNCVCGKSLVACAEWKAIEPVRQSMRDWESRNVRLLAEGKRHGLPDDHPEVLKAGMARRPGTR
jgi:hypothetical protein